MQCRPPTRTSHALSLSSQSVREAPGIALYNSPDIHTLQSPELDNTADTALHKGEEGNMLNSNPEQSESSSVTYSEGQQSTFEGQPPPPGSGPDHMDPNHFLQMYGVLDNHCNICDELTDLIDNLDHEHQLGFLHQHQHQPGQPPEAPRPQTVSVGVQTSAPVKPCRGHGRTLLEQLQQSIPHLQVLFINSTN